LITSIEGSNGFSIPDLGILLAKILGFVGGSLWLGLLIVPRIVNHVLRMNNNEVLLLVILGLVFGLSIAADRLGFSMAIGAFLMGVIIASSDCVDCVNTLVGSVRDMFAAIFFVSVGALIDITQVADFIVPSILITVLMVFGKVVGVGGGTKLFGYSNSIAIKVGLGMSQIGEFAFIVMIAGRNLGVISPFLFSVVGVAAGITTFLTPYLIKLSYRIKMK
jgi:CPA2 family monovalent cation:H+ antiporter-2